MDLERRAEILLGHGRAFDVPAGPAWAPRRLPVRVLARLRRLPEGEVARVILEWVRLLLLNLVGTLTRQPAIVLEARHAEVHVAAGLVGEPPADQLLDQRHDLGHGLRRLRLVVRPAEPEPVGVLHVPPGGLLGELRARAWSRVVDLVVDVGDVLHECHVVAAQRQPVPQPHRDDERPRVADVDPLVDRRSTEVHADRAGRWRRLLEASAERAVEAHPKDANCASRRSREPVSPLASGRRAPPTARDRWSHR